MAKTRAGGVGCLRLGERRYDRGMRFGELKSIGHNISASLASGIGLMIGHYSMDIFGEASASPEGFMDVDFLSGATAGAPPSRSLSDAITRYRHALRNLCHRHGGDVSEFTTLQVRFGVDVVYGPHFTVTVENKKGRKSVDQYLGISGRRIRSRRR